MQQCLTAASTSELNQLIGLAVRLALVIAAAYFGSVIGMEVWAFYMNGYRTVAWSDFNPMELRIALSLDAPLLLGPLILVSGAFVILRRIPMWFSIFVAAGFAILRYMAAAAWHVH
jgi:hypothetical protein